MSDLLDKYTAFGKSVKTINRGLIPSGKPTQKLTTMRSWKELSPFGPLKHVTF
jgi:hypothetical protein